MAELLDNATDGRARSRSALVDDLRWMVGEMRPRRLRSIGEFAEAEIVIPDGQWKGRKFSRARQPFSGLLFDAIDRGAVLSDGRRGPWRRIILVGPTQSGKTLAGFVIPILYTLFELRETCICVVPDLDMVHDKWARDLLPAIRASRFRSLLPVRGEGSRGGRVRSSVEFLNGTTLRFMTAGGDDTARAAFTSRVAAITELNKFGKRKEASDEADMFRQIQGRLRSYGDRGLIWAECTVTTERGLVWTEYEAGTGSRVAMPCGHCGEYVSPGREHLVGWEDAGSVVEAERLARWCCPSCGVIWEPGERERFARGSVLLHRGQTVEKSEGRRVKGEKKKGRADLQAGRLLPGYRIVGDAPDTWALSFRWSAVDNLFLSTGFLGAGEWSARHLAENEDSAEREQLQFVWALPVKDERDQSLTLRADALCHRQGRFGRGVVPPGTDLVAFLDLGKYRCHWVVLARSAGGLDSRVRGNDEEGSGEDAGGRYWVVDCGVIATEADHLSERDALLVAMREFHERCEQGWGDVGGGEPWSPGLRLIDSGKWTAEVYEFLLEMAMGGHGGYFPSKGFGVSQDQARVYSERTAVTERVLVLGDRYHLARQESPSGVDLVLLHMDVDAWKSRVHAALRAPVGAAGSLVLWKGDWREHMPMARALVSEVGVEEFLPEKGMVMKWVKKHRENHFLDGVVGCFVGLDYLGMLEGAPEASGQSGQSGQSGPVDDGGRFRMELPGFGGALGRE